jgi:hypothetical protein
MAMARKLDMGQVYLVRGKQAVDANVRYGNLSSGKRVTVTLDPAIRPPRSPNELLRHLNLGMINNLGMVRYLRLSDELGKLTGAITSTLFYDQNFRSAFAENRRLIVVGSLITNASKESNSGTITGFTVERKAYTFEHPITV